MTRVVIPIDRESVLLELNSIMTEVRLRLEKTHSDDAWTANDLLIAMENEIMERWVDILS